MFYEVNFDDETRVLFEGQASGAITKGRGTSDFIPDDALDNVINLMRMVSIKVATEVAPTIDGTLCAFECEFGIRADGNGTVMISQDRNNAQFKITIKRPVIKRTTRPVKS
jgi:hypothetical protein